MVISDQYQFIFIHIPKTGGTSIKRALRSQAIFMPKRSRVQRVLTRLHLNNNYKTYRFRTHGNLRSVQKVMPESLFNHYTKFSVVRNPWSKLLSEFVYFQKGSETHKNVQKRRGHRWTRNLGNFEEFLKIKATHSDASQYSYLKNNDGEIGVDMILKQETLNEDFKRLCNHIGLKLELQFHNVTRDKKLFNHYDNSELIDFVAYHWQEDIETFNYQLPL